MLVVPTFHAILAEHASAFSKAVAAPPCAFAPALDGLDMETRRCMVCLKPLLFTHPAILLTHLATHILRPLAQVLSEEAAHIRVATASGANAGYQFKTHPNIDKGAYSASGVLGLKDPARPFPTGSALGILKWRLQVCKCLVLFEVKMAKILAWCLCTMSTGAVCSWEHGHFLLAHFLTMRCENSCPPQQGPFGRVPQPPAFVFPLRLLSTGPICMQTTDDSLAPLSINCWPSVSGAESYVNIEYEATSAFDLQTVVIAIPLPAMSHAPRVSQVGNNLIRLETLLDGVLQKLTLRQWLPSAPSGLRLLDAPRVVQAS